MGDDSVLTRCALVLAVDEAVIATDSCSGDPRARRVLDVTEFRCDPDSDRMLCWPWIPSALDTSVRETGVTLCLSDILADFDSGAKVSFLAPQRCRGRTILNDYCAPDIGECLQGSRVLPSVSADVACGMVSGTLASGVMLSGGEVRIDLIELRDFHYRPGFDRTLGDSYHSPEGWAVVCWPRLTLMNGLSRTDWDPGGGGRYAQAETMGTISLVIFGFRIWLNGI